MNVFFFAKHLKFQLRFTSAVRQFVYAYFVQCIILYINRCNLYDAGCCILYTRNIKYENFIISIN